MKAYDLRLASLSLTLLLLLGWAGRVHADVQALCSPQNTGAGGDSHKSEYQSNGACVTTCQGYAFGVVQYNQCWCTNIAPADTVDVSECSQTCPGFPYENCGNTNSGLFGYVALGKAPQQTADSDSSSSKAPPDSKIQISPDTNTVTQVVTSIAVSVQSPPPESPSEASPTSESTTSTWSPTPSPSVLTVGGSIKTIVVTPTRAPQATTTIAVPNSDANAAKATSNGFFSNKGAVAGVFTVVGLLAAALIVGALFFCWKRQRKDQESSERLNSMEEDRNSVVPSTFISRRTSELGLRTDVPRVGTSDEKTPTSMHLGMATPGTMSRRASMPLTDQRLNPATLYHDNGSHLSVASLQDNQDYSRPVLQITNPDRPGSSAIEDD